VGTAGVGAPGAGDPYFPLQGNGGYDVNHYNLDLRYDPATGRLSGTVTIIATATEALTRFDLDLRRQLTVSAVTVNGAAAPYAQPADLVQELVITPAQPFAAGGGFTVAVSYAGVPPVITDPDNSIEGMIPTADGSSPSASRRAPRAGSLATTRRPTRPATTSAARCRRA
jgi:aminopeptidase N